MYNFEKLIKKKEYISLNNDAPLNSTGRTDLNWNENEKQWTVHLQKGDEYKELVQTEDIEIAMIHFLFGS